MYLAFGHDEEVGGDLGAGAMAALLKSRSVTLDMILDEGGPILVDGLPSLLRVPAQIALVGTAEKVICCSSSQLRRSKGNQGDEEVWCIIASCVAQMLLQAIEKSR